MRRRRGGTRRGVPADPLRHADAALAGGVEVPLSPLAFGAFDIIRALSAGHNDTPASAARPFDADRDGFVMGEAAALLVLESADVAQRRGAVPYAELRGFGATSDAFHMVQPRPDGRQAARAARIALADGGMKARDIDYVNAHASSTPLGDGVEAGAIAVALGPRSQDRAGERHQGVLRPPTRCVGRDRGRDRGPRDQSGLGAGHREPRNA